MKKYHIDNRFQRYFTKRKLQKNGIIVDNETGKISYGSNKMNINCEAVYLLRHAQTYATKNHEFMSNNSKNSHICREGINDICLTKEEVKKYNFDVVIVCCDIPRVMETSYVFKLVNPELKYIYKRKFYGIDNGGWEGKTKKTLDADEIVAYQEREEKQNIFAKSCKGGSWAKVLLNSIFLIQYLNKECKGQRVLLISQGSILKGLNILTHADEKPWGNYDTSKLYNLDKSQTKSNYAAINCLYDNKEK